MKRGVVFALSVFLLGCAGSTAGNDTSDCEAWTCTSEVEITFADGRSDFQIGLSGDQFANYNIACPDGPSVGGPGNVAHECLEGGLKVSWPERSFPDTLQITVDSEEPTEHSPEWAVVTGCSLSCTSGALTIE